MIITIKLLGQQIGHGTAVAFRPDRTKPRSRFENVHENTYIGEN